ncbi:outer membrane beta-barrel protein [Corallococcus sp. ZKHCc1 1396]|uniref:Outer membrane beta-barrel protein n=1 Tax=Corallococcus soli TaxID=2710757 RepID=A0ABR9PYS8_9BACT|nr:MULTISPECIES: outer membrane beta-barrel protein [Corallococcus]MBE4753079.1 outer membrane beta-barrel protein [Corallococcus soli]MCY1031575.1 outer membrane beta-barrel protein [Corallococcus sp. BB11-1]
MLRRTLQCGALLFPLLGAGSALAEKKQGDVNVFLKGGVGDYTGALGELSSTGPQWGLTLNVQPTTFLGLEVGYEGSQNKVSDTRLFDGPSLVRNGGSALIKVSPPFLTAVRPFAGVGLGLSYVDVRGAGAGLYDSDLMEEVPLAVGLEFNTGGLTAGVRGTYRVLIDQDFADAAANDDGGGLMDASLTLGARF